MDVLTAYQHGMARGSLDPTCGGRFTVSRALLCKGDFVAQRHNGIQNLLTSLLSKVCKDVDIKRNLLPIDSEVFNLRSTVTSPEARLDINAGSFWSRGETAFFGVCRTHVNSTCNQNKSTASIFLEHEKDKKRNYQQNGKSYASAISYFKTIFSNFYDPSTHMFIARVPIPF